MTSTTSNATSAQDSVNKGSEHSSAIFNRVVVWMTYAYLMRVPIIMGFVLVILPFLALLGLRPLLQNLFVLNAEGTVWTTAIALALCWSILLTSRLVRLNGERFGLPQALTLNTLKPKSVLLVCSLAAPLILAQFVERHEFALDRGAILWRVGAVVVGGAVAYAVAFVGLFLTVLVAPRGNSPADKTFPAFEPLRRLLALANSHGVPRSWMKKLGTRLKQLPEGLWIGYLDPDCGLLWAGHWLALTFAVSIGVVTFVLDLYRRAYLGEKSPVPALAYVLIFDAEFELDPGVFGVSARSVSHPIACTSGDILRDWRAFAIV